MPLVARSIRRARDPLPSLRPAARGALGWCAAFALVLALEACSSGSSGDPAAPDEPSATNQPPRLESVVPEEETVSAETGRPLTFEVAAVDPEGRPLTFEFRLDGRRVATDARYVLDDAGEGRHQLELVVSDGVKQVVRHWDITVVPDAPHPPAASLSAAPDSGVAPMVVTIQGSATDVDGTVVRYDLDADGDGVFETTGAEPPSATRTFATPGTYLLRLRVMDDDSLSAVAERRVRVVANQPPHAELSVTPSEGPAPLSVHVHGSGTDPEGALSSVELDLDGDGGYDVSAPVVIDTTLVYEDYTRPTTLTLRVADASGADATARATVTPHPDVDAAASQLTQDGTDRLLSDGKAVRRITARIVDPAGRPLKGVEVDLASSRNGGPMGVVDRIQPARGTTDAAGLFTSELRTNSSSVLLGDAVIRATAGGEDLSSTVTVQFVTPVNALRSEITSCPFSAIHVRSSSSEPNEAVIEVVVRDIQNQPLPDMWVELKTRDPVIWPVEPAGGRSDANGKFRATVTSDRPNDNTFVDFYADGYRTSSTCVLSFIP